jgi:hypothetical protein
LFTLLQIKHSHTTPYHPQCYAQAEVQNKDIQKYLAAFVDKITLDWPLYMAPMTFAYNTALHHSIKSTPFFLTYGIDARTPSLPDPDLNRYYHQSDVAAWYATLQQCRQIAAQNNIQASNYMQSQFNKKALPFNYTLGQLIRIDVQNYLDKNRKLSPVWEGPFTICRIFETGVVEIIYKNHKKYKVNVVRTKPYIEPVQMQNQDIILPPISNYFDPNVCVNQNFVPQPVIPQQQAAAPRCPPPPPAQPALLLPAQPLPPPRNLNDFDFNLPFRHMNRNLVRNFNRALPLGQLVVPLPVPLPANLPNPIVNIAPPPLTLAPPAPGMGQPILVPQFVRQAPVAPPPLVPPQPQPVPAGQPLIPDKMTVTRTLRHHNNIQLLPPLSAIYKNNHRSQLIQQLLLDLHLCLITLDFPLSNLVSELPPESKTVIAFSKILSPAARNLALTGDPFFAFDNITYESAWVPRPPPDAADNHIPQPVVVDPPLPVAPIIPPLARHVTPPPPPRVPQQCYPLLVQF